MMTSLSWFGITGFILLIFSAFAGLRAATAGSVGGAFFCAFILLIGFLMLRSDFMLGVRGER